MEYPMQYSNYNDLENENSSFQTSFAIVLLSYPLTLPVCDVIFANSNVLLCFFSNNLFTALSLQFITDY